MIDGVTRNNRNGLTWKSALYEKLSNKYALIILTVAPATALFIFVNLFPIGWAIYAGMFEIPLFEAQWTWIGLDNYSALFKNDNFWASLERSVVFAGGSVSLQLVLGILVALLINQQFKFNQIIRAIVILPFMVPTALLGFIALWMGNSTFGISNIFLRDIGLIKENIAWFGSPDWAMASVIITNSWKFSIFVTIMVLARLQSIPDDFYEAAEMAGANAIQKFRYVTLPQLKGVIFIVLLLRGVWMFNKFDIIWVLTAGGPADATTTAPIFTYETAFGRLQLGQAAAISTTLFILLAAAAVIYFYTLNPEQEVRVE